MYDVLNKYVIQMKKGDFSSFDMFYQLTYKKVYFTSLRILKDPSLSEDIVQDTYMKFIENISQFRNDYVSSYLITIARNLSINLYHKRSKEIFPEQDEYFDFVIVEQTLKLNDEYKELIQIGINTLSSLEKDVFLLYTLEDMKHREIALILDKPIGTITWAYQNAIKKIKDAIKEVSL